MTSLASAPAAISALKLLLVLLAIATLALPAGCAECPDELVSVDQIVAAHNANAASVPRLWARVEMSVTLKPSGGPPMTWRSGSPTSLLLYRRGDDPAAGHDFVLVGRETAAVELFRMGSSTEQGLYYFWYKFGNRAGAWFGQNALAGAPGVKYLPIDPIQLLGVLGITPLPDEPGRLPAAALSMRNKPGDCAYVVTVIERQPISNRVRFTREIVIPWAKDKPLRPRQVNIFDGSGRRAMTARLSNYRPIDVSSMDDPPAKSPLMPTDIEIVCNDLPGVDTFLRTIHLRLTKMTVEDKWLPEAVRFAPPAGTRTVQVDNELPKPATRDSAARTGPDEKRGEQ